MKNNASKDLFKQIFMKFLIKIIVLTTAIICGFIVISSIISKLNFQWLYDKSPSMYYKLIDTFNHIFNSDRTYLYVIGLIIIVIVIYIYKLTKKLLLYINSMDKAIDVMFDKQKEYVKLPGELVDIEVKMNHLKHESEKNERMARENEQRKNDLIVYLAHDLKTPLTSIIGYLSLLNEIKDMPKKQAQKYVNVALEKSYKLEDLINELFDIARFNSEKIILEKEEVNLNMMLEQIIDEFYPILRDNNKKIKLDIEDKIMMIADPDKMARVFSNLIKNAIYYSTDNLITIEAKKDNGSAKIVITNKGKKISEEKLKRIFEKFYRADSSRTSKTGGSGLGLAIAKQITELHGGSIKATSDDEYTKFYIDLPLN